MSPLVEEIKYPSPERVSGLYNITIDITGRELGTSVQGEVAQLLVLTNEGMVTGKKE